MRNYTKWRTQSKPTVDVDQRYVRAVDGALPRGVGRLGSGCVAVDPVRGAGSPSRVGGAKLLEGHGSSFLPSHRRNRAIRAVDRRQFGAGFPLRDDHPGQVSRIARFFSSNYLLGAALEAGGTCGVLKVVVFCLLYEKSAN